MSGDTNNTFNIHGNVGQVAQTITAETISNVNNYGPPAEMSQDQFFAHVESSVPPEVKEEVVAPLRAWAKAPESDPPKDELKKGWLDRLKPYGPRIAKACLAGGIGALKALMSRNPAVAFVLHGLEEWRRMEPEGYRGLPPIPTSAKEAYSSGAIE